MGRHLTGMAEAKLVYGLLSAGTQEQPDTRHLVNDFQRTGKTLFICVMVLGIKAMYIHVCVCECQNCPDTAKVCFAFLFVCFTCVCVH